MKKLSMNKFKKFNIMLLFIFIAIYSIFITVNYLCYKNYTEALWIKNIYDKKLAYSNSIKKPKIILLGGSNLFFSVKAATIEQEFNIPTLNLGTHAGLGLVYILDRAKKQFIKPRDTVLLSVEYNLFNENSKGCNLMYSYLLSYERKTFDSLSIFDKLKALSTISFKELIKSFVQRAEVKKNGLNSLSDLVYNEKNMDKNGDQLMNIGHKSSDFDHKNKVFEDLKTHLNYKSESMKSAIDFIYWCKKNNVKIIYTYPTMPYHKEYLNKEYDTLRNDITAFWIKENIPVLNTKDVYFLDDEYFYDTGMHLNYKGRDVRTQAVIKEFKKVLK